MSRAISIESVVQVPCDHYILMISARVIVINCVSVIECCAIKKQRRTNKKRRRRLLGRHRYNIMREVK